MYEISHDSGTLAQGQAVYLQLCESSPLFVPTTWFQFPRLQQLGMRLTTAQANIPVRWEFKIGFMSSLMAVPDIGSMFYLFTYLLTCRCGDIIIRIKFVVIKFSFLLILLGFS